LTDTVKNIAREDFFVEDAEVLLKDPEQKDYHSYNQSVKIPNQAEIIKLVQEKKQLISHDELLNDPQFQSIKISSLAQMARIEAAFLQPIFYHDEMIAILCLGRLKSGVSLILKDITFLGFLANQTGVALENAKLYDSSGRAKRKLEELNLELEQKVKERTGEVEKRNLQLEETNEKIANATQHKAEFLSSMSHELRTPLNGILGFSDLILEGIYGKIPERVSGTLAYLKESGTTLLLIINNILDLSKIEAGKLEILAEEFEAKEMMEQQLKEISIKAEAKKIKLASSFSPNLPPAWADSKRTRQIITNLLSNAISYTNKGNIEINVSSNKKEIDFEIKDSGIGISSDRMKMIFNEFEKPETYLKKIHKGAGLGLPLSKKLAELQGGKLTIKSRQGKGTVFNLILPAKQQ